VGGGNLAGIDVTKFAGQVANDGHRRFANMVTDAVGTAIAGSSTSPCLSTAYALAWAYALACDFITPS
jgi:hypothetical protein